MTILHHPSEETLATFMSSSLCEANSLVVATHVAHCPECRSLLRDMAEVGGNLLEKADAASIAPASRAATLAKLDAAPVHVQPQASRRPAPDNMQRAMDLMSLYDHGAWKWVGPGVYHQFLDVPSETGTRVFLLKSAPGTRLPDHRHLGTEWTCVLKGAFRHDHGRFGAGDFDEADESVEHNPYVEEGEECICLVALNGNVEMTGWLGRLIQPLVRI